jgi:hypothetical protein
VWLATDCPDGDSLGNALEVEVVVDGESVTDGYRPLAAVERDLATGVRIDAGCLDPDDDPIVVEVAPYLPADSPDVGGETTDLVFRLYAEQCRHVSEAEANAPGANPFAGVACEQTCVPCEKSGDEGDEVRIGTLKLRYLGGDPATVVVVATSGGAGGVGNGGTIVFDGEVAPQGTFVVDGADAGTNTSGWIGPNIFLDDGAGGESEAPETAGGNGNNANDNGNNANDNGNNANDNGNNANDNRNNGRGGSGRGGGKRPEGVRIHTSCSEPLRVGDIYGGLYKVVDGRTTDGEPLCGSEAN